MKVWQLISIFTVYWYKRILIIVFRRALWAWSFLLEIWPVSNRISDRKRKPDYCKALTPLRFLECRDAPWPGYWRSWSVWNSCSKWARERRFATNWFFNRIIRLCQWPEGSRRFQRHAFFSHPVDQLHRKLLVGGKSGAGCLGVPVIRYDAGESGWMWILCLPETRSNSWARMIEIKSFF